MWPLLNASENLAGGRDGVLHESSDHQNLAGQTRMPYCLAIFPSFIYLKKKKKYPLDTAKY